MPELPTEHFRAIMLHHLLHDGLEYIKTFVDLAVGVKKLSGQYTSVTKDQPLTNQPVNISLDSLNKSYRTNVLFIAMDKLFGIGDAAIKNKTLEEEQIANQFLQFNLNSTVGRYKRHKVLSLLNHYKRTIRNRAALIRDHRDRRQFAITFWINLFTPQQADEEAVPLPRWLKPFYFIIRPIRILLRKKSSL